MILPLSPIFFLSDPPTTEIYTLSLHDALPISVTARRDARGKRTADGEAGAGGNSRQGHVRSEEHTSELQSQSNLVCRLLLEKKKASASELLERELMFGKSSRPSEVFRRIGTAF